MPDIDSEQERLWVRNYQPRPQADTQLFCLPHAGGSASYYLPLSRKVSSSIDVSIVQYPGRQDRRKETMIGSIDGLADAILPWLVSRSGPIVLFGHSMGALVGYELVRRWQEVDSAANIIGFIASGRRAPRIVKESSFDFEDRDRLLKEMRALSGTQAELFEDEEVVEAMLPVLQNDYRASWEYRPRPGPKLRVPVAGIVGDSDPQVSIDEAAAWDGETGAPFRLHKLEGGHFYGGTDQVALAATVDDCVDWFRGGAQN